MATTRKIALIGGDGIGPEVVREARMLLEIYRDDAGLPLDLWDLDLGADRFLRDGATFPNEIRVAIQRECSAVFLGALGDPRVPGMEHARDIIFGMRQGFDLYANVRPVRALSDRLVPLKNWKAKDINFVVFRENTEGIYVGMGGQFKRGTPDEVAINEDVNTRKGVERIIRAAFEFAKQNGKTVVHMADKSNAMRHAHELWLRVFDHVSREYAPTITAKHVYIDALCLYVIQDPSQFQVVVTNNLFGDIVTDLGAALQGGLGMAASANVHGLGNDRVGMFEPVHGSAPPLAGKDLANPFAAFLTVGMMLSSLGWPDEEKRIEQAVSLAIEEKKCTRDVGGELGTKAAAEWVRAEVRRLVRGRLPLRSLLIAPVRGLLERMSRQRVRWSPLQEQMDLWPTISGNAINGLGERAVRKPSPIYWHAPEATPHGPLQRWFYGRASSMVAEARGERQRAIDEPLEDVSPTRITRTPEELSAEVKRAALASGADAVGIARVKPEWVFEGHEVKQAWVIVVGVAHTWSALSQAPADVAAAEVIRQYARGIRVAKGVARMLRRDGLDAYPHGGPMAFPMLLIPPAIEAGLGELGKHGSLIHRELGSSFRLACVLTDAPLIADAPDDFGGDDFCTLCRSCVDACPPDAIYSEKQLVRGETRWYVDFDKCLPFFNENQGCAICLAVCPWNRPGVASTLVRKMAARRSQGSG